ncbi:MAG: NAD-dependent epimerase/dehydratase family protein [Candidatus Altiarchaeota archaeon]
MSEKILVTGANGFIGANLTSLLLKKGNEVIAFSRPGQSPHPMLESQDVEWRYGDVCDKKSVENAISGCSQVYHLAAKVSFNQADYNNLYKVNVKGTRNVAEAARKAGVKRLVYTSACAVFGYSKNAKALLNETSRPHLTESSPYAYTKNLGEAEVRKQIDEGLSAVIVNPATVYGAGDQKLVSGGLIKRITFGGVHFAPPGGTTTVSIGDVVEGHILAMKKGRDGESYILAAENLTYLELFNRIASVVGAKPVKYVLPRFTYPFALAGVTAFSEIKSLMGSPPAIMTPQILKETYSFKYYDSSKAKRELGWDPKKIFETAVEDAFNYYRIKDLI